MVTRASFLFYWMLFGLLSGYWENVCNLNFLHLQQEGSLLPAARVFVSSVFFCWYWASQRGTLRLLSPRVNFLISLPCIQNPHARSWHSSRISWQVCGAWDPVTPHLHRILSCFFPENVLVVGVEGRERKVTFNPRTGQEEQEKLVLDSSAFGASQLLLIAVRAGLSCAGKVLPFAMSLQSSVALFKALKEMKGL